MGALLELIPLKDWLYAGLLIIVIAFSVHEYREIEAKGAAKEAAAVQAVSSAVQAQAKKTNDKLTADYSAAVVTVGENYAKSMQSAATAHDADLKLLQRRAASSGGSGNSAVAGAAGTAAPSGAGNEGFSGLGGVALELATALRADDAALAQCYADRDSLTGK
jgi:hypothetical protein